MAHLEISLLKSFDAIFVTEEEERKAINYGMKLKEGETVIPLGNMK